MAKMVIEISAKDIDVVREILKLIEDDYLTLPIEFREKFKQILEKDSNDRNTDCVQY